MPAKAKLFYDQRRNTEELQRCIHGCGADVKGVIQPPRKIPYATQPLGSLTEGSARQADVDKPTEWVSKLVIVEKKSGALRLCLDPRPLNAVIKREGHVIPTPADVQAQLSGKNVFTVVDMKDGY